MADEIKKLNLGCGVNKKEGYINLDWNESGNPDVVYDLNKTPYPFNGNEFDIIEASHIIEHLDKPFDVMKELHRILKPNGKLIIKVPHFSRGFTHAEHSHGFDVTFPFYFIKKDIVSGFYGVEYKIEKIRLHWLAFFHLMPLLGCNKFLIGILYFINAVISFLANLNPFFCSRIWCFWVGGFEEIEFTFVCVK